MSFHVELCIMVFANPARLAQLLRCQRAQHLRHVRVVESPTSADVAHAMQDLALSHDCFYSCCAQPGEMQSTAQHAMATTLYDWVILWPDDVLPTPGAFEHVSRWLWELPSHVGAVQLPYWNFSDYRRAHPTLAPRTTNIILEHQDLDWLDTVPRNPHWETPGPAYYVNCNGAGFALRRLAWRDVDGFSPHTWCFDEDIAARLWLSKRWTVVSVPGPPVMHQGAGAMPDRALFGCPNPKSQTLEGWLEAWNGESKDLIHLRCREQMALWSAKTNIPAR